jgi:uncharacterized protein YdaT
MTEELEWTINEDEILVKTIDEQKFHEIFPSRSPSNIYIRKLVLAQGMVEKDKRAIDYVCKLMKVNNKDLLERIDSSIKSNSKKGVKKTKKIADESHANLLYSYTELKEQLDRIEATMGEILNKLKY